MFLSNEVIQELTGRILPHAQAKQLNRQGIEHKFDADGKVLVLEAHFMQQFGFKGNGAERKETSPNWEAIGA